MSESPNTQHAQAEPPPIWRGWIAWAIILGLIGWSFWGLRETIHLERLASAPARMGDFLGRMWPPDFTQGTLLVKALIETVQMALIGTVLGAIVSLPLAGLATRRLAPSWLTIIVRLFLNVIRTIPSLIWGLLFVAAVGLGPLPGVLALAFYSGGYLTKFYYEAFESADFATADALRGAGATGIQIFQHAIWPPARPLIISQTLFMFEYNVRAAAILGYVGAGGIGTYLKIYFEGFQYQKALACLIIMLAVVILLDWLGGWVRRKFVD